MKPADEKDLIKRMKQDPEVFGQVYDHHFEAIFNYILHRVAHVQTAEDLTSQTFFKAMRNLWKFRWSGVPVSAWLFRIATNEANSHLRRRKRCSSLGNEVFSELPADRRSLPDRELIAAEEQVLRDARFLELHACIETLGSDDQSLIVLRYFENKSYSEISLILGKREGSLRMRVKRALDKLKAHLQERGKCDVAPGRNGKNREQPGNAEGGGRILSAQIAAQSPRFTSKPAT